MGEAPDHIAKKSDGTDVKLGLYEVISADVTVFDRDFVAERVGGQRPGNAGWPIECVSSGVNAEQAPELRKFFKDRNFNCEVTCNGDPVYTSPTHRRKALKLRGFRDNAGFC